MTGEASKEVDRGLSLPGGVVRRMAILILSLVGMAISAYLTYVHYQQTSTICSPGMECDAVLSSPYAQMWGVPLSLLGLGMYTVLTVLGWLLWRGRSERRELVGLGAYTVAMSATLFSLYLYYLEIFEIHAFCTWCVVSSVIVFGLLVLTSVNLFSSEGQPVTCGQ